MPKAKKFIDRKNAVTFHLVHRSQKDPLIADEDAPQLVLKPQDDGELDKRKEEERKWGIFYDDDYNYMQHLRDAQDVSVMWAPAVDPSQPIVPKEKKKSKKKLNLPSSVFASEIEENVGLLNKAAPQSGLRLDLDPDIVAAMDEDFDFEDPNNELEDNFMELAMKQDFEEDDEYNEEVDEEYEDEEEEEDDLDSQEGFASDNQFTDSENEEIDEDKFRNMYDNDDAKSRFSTYSMSSSVMRRSNGLTLLDDRFEKMFAEYDDTEIGALDTEDLEGKIDATPENLLKCAEQFHDQNRTYQLDEDREVKRIVKLKGIAEEDEDKEITEEELFGKDEDNKLRWDCESILSTYSNIYNHPRLIDEPKKNKKIQISAKTGIPLGVLSGSDGGKLTMKSLAKFNLQQNEIEREKNGEDASICESVTSVLSVLSLRPKDETADERKERKRLLKAYRQERRVEKKANAEAFKEEKKRQEKISINNRQNIQGIKIV